MGTLLERQIQFLDDFISKLKIEPMEVLKLNRENKWQLRFLTITKEEIPQLRCPQGILWLKKNPSKKVYSVKNIDRQGKGGMLLQQLSDAEQLTDLKSLPR